MQLFIKHWKNCCTLCYLKNKKIPEHHKHIQVIIKLQRIGMFGPCKFFKWRQAWNYVWFNRHTDQALNSGVHNPWSVASRSAPAARMNSAQAELLLEQAQWRAVFPVKSDTLISANNKQEIKYGIKHAFYFQLHLQLHNSCWRMHINRQNSRNYGPRGAPSRMYPIGTHNHDFSQV